MKICALIPVYMTDNSRHINLENLNKLKKTEFTYVDEVVICDQCFIDTDYIDGFTYLGPFKTFKNKVADARNILFEWFYASDYDYALLLDAREYLSASGMNSFATLTNAIHSDNFSADFVQGTMGQVVNTQRIQDKCRDDYRQNVWVRRVSSIQPQLHHTFISNFNKKYGIELYLPADKMGAASGNKFGIPDDIYFSKLCQTYFDVFIVGEMCVNTGKQSASTWAVSMSSEKHTDGEYYRRAEELIFEKYNPRWLNKKHSSNIILSRVDDYINELGEYKARSKAVKKPVKSNKVNLF